MNLKIKLFPKYAYLVSSTIALILFLYFAYKAFAAYLIHKELYGDGMDVLVSLRAALAGIMFLLIVLFFQFMKIKDLKSQRTILRGIFCWLVFLICNINNSESSVIILYRTKWNRRFRKSNFFI